MVDETDDLPVDELYEDGVSIPHNPEDLIFMELQRGWETVKWTDIEATGDTLQALVEASTQFHYILLSQILLLGRLLEQEEDMSAKRLAIILAAARMRKVDTWGRYLGQAQTTSTVSSELKEYFNNLYEDKQVVSRLMGLMLADIYLFAIGTVLEDIGDTLFGRLIRRDMRQAEKNLEVAEEYFRDRLREMTDAEEEQVRERIGRYQDAFEEFVVDQAASFEPFGKTEAEVTSIAHEQISDFYGRIGLEE